MRALIIGYKKIPPSKKDPYWIPDMTPLVGSVLEVYPHPYQPDWVFSNSVDDYNNTWNWHKDWVKIL